MVEAVLPPCSLAWGSPVLESAVPMVELPYGNLYGRAHCNLLQECLCQHTVPDRTAAANGPDPAADHCQTTVLQETPTHSQASLAQSFVGSLLLFPESWCSQGFVCVLQESLFHPALWKFCNQIPLTFTSGDSQSLCQIPRLGSLMCILEPSQQCEKLFGIIVLQFLGHPSGSSMVGLMVTSFKKTYANTPLFPRLLLPVALSVWQTTADSHLLRKPSNTHG